MTTPLDELRSFDVQSLPNLNIVVLGALEYLSGATIPSLNVREYTRPLVIGSVNALSTGRVLFESVDAVFAEEGNYHAAFLRVPQIDAVYIFSASGGKHAVHIAKDVAMRGLPTFLVTSTEHAPAAAYLDSSRVLVFPHIREPYTYNTSTYMGMMLGNSSESPAEIRTFIEDVVRPSIPKTLGTFTSFVLTVQPQFAPLRSMFMTKFDELFAPVVTGRAFTDEEIKHAKIIVSSPTQYFLNFGVAATGYANVAQQLEIPILPQCGPVAMLAIGYYVIGCIQEQHEPYFARGIGAYIDRASTIFNQSLSVIVE